MNILVCVKPALAGADSAMVTREKAALEISRQDLLAYSCALWLRREVLLPCWRCRLQTRWSAWSPCMPMGQIGLCF